MRKLNLSRLPSKRPLQGTSFISISTHQQLTPLLNKYQALRFLLKYKGSRQDRCPAEDLVAENQETILFSLFSHYLKLMYGPGPNGSPLLPESPATVNICWDSKQGVQLFLALLKLPVNFLPAQTISKAFTPPQSAQQKPKFSSCKPGQARTFKSQGSLKMRTSQSPHYILPPPPIEMSHGVLMSSAQNIVFPALKQWFLNTVSITWSMAVSILYTSKGF